MVSGNLASPRTNGFDLSSDVYPRVAVTGRLVIAIVMGGVSRALAGLISFGFVAKGSIRISFKANVNVAGTV